MTDLDNYEINALRADAAAGEYDHTEQTPTGHGETVTTWADAFGIWHARVDFPDRGYGPGYLAVHTARIRAKARRAIRRELMDRQAPGTLAPVRVQLVATNQDAMNLTHSNTFAEINR